MHVPSFPQRACAVVAFLAASVASAAAGGRPIHPGGLHGAIGGFRPFAGARSWGGRGVVPPVSGVIHERPGARPYLSAYGHTGTALRDGGGPAAYGPIGAAIPGSRLRPYATGYGHVGTALRPLVYAAGRPVYGRYGLGRGAVRPGEARRFFARRGFVGGLGGIGYGYGAPGVYGVPGVYGEAGTYGAPGTYGGEGGYGSTATQDLYGNGGLAPYRSETPLAARYSEPPLAPSPYAPYSPEDRYADAGPSGITAGPRVIRVHGARPWDACGCGRGPAVLPYGVGTAY